MRLTYDDVADAAYVYLVDAIAPGGVARTAASMIELDMAFIAFDFNSDGKVLGLEILGASRLLADETLKAIGRLPVRMSYDADADAAYVYLVNEIRSGDVHRSARVDPVEVGGMINLDFGVDGRLLGIEIFGASEVLPPEVLRGRE